MTVSALTTSCKGPYGTTAAGAVPLTKRKKDALGLTTAAVSATKPATAPSGAFFTTGVKVPFHMLQTMYADDGVRFFRKDVPVYEEPMVRREVVLTPSDRRYLAGVTCD